MPLFFLFLPAADEGSSQVAWTVGPSVQTSHAAKDLSYPWSVTTWGSSQRLTFQQLWHLLLYLREDECREPFQKGGPFALFFAVEPLLHVVWFRDCWQTLKIGLSSHAHNLESLHCAQDFVCSG